MRYVIEYAIGGPDTAIGKLWWPSELSDAWQSASSSIWNAVCVRVERTRETILYLERHTDGSIWLRGDAGNPAARPIRTPVTPAPPTTAPE